MKGQIRLVSDNTRLIKQEGRETNGAVLRIEKHMAQYNEGMMKITNFVKVFFNITFQLFS